LKRALDTRGAGPDDELVRELRREQIRRARADAELAEIELSKSAKTPKIREAI